MDEHVFTYYIAGGGGLGSRALVNFERLVRPRLAGSCTLKVVDVLAEPRLAREHRIVATPMLVREQPLPVIKILGDLSQETKVLEQLGLARENGSSTYSSPQLEKEYP